MWQDLVDQKETWIGGKLVDYGDAMDRRMFADNWPLETELQDIVLTDSYISFVGKDFTCSGSRQYVGISGQDIEELPYQGLGLLLYGYGGHQFRIIEKANDIKEVDSNV